MFCIHGLFHIIVTIMAHPLKNLKNFVEKIGIKHITITRYCPSLNGAAERAVQTFKNAMIIFFQIKNTSTHYFGYYYQDFYFHTVILHMHKLEKHPLAYCLTGKRID